VMPSHACTMKSVLSSKAKVYVFQIVTETSLVKMAEPVSPTAQRVFQVVYVLQISMEQSVRMISVDVGTCHVLMVLLVFQKTALTCVIVHLVSMGLIVRMISLDVSQILALIKQCAPLTTILTDVLALQDSKVNSAPSTQKHALQSDLVLQELTQDVMRLVIELFVIVLGVQQTTAQCHVLQIRV